MSEVLQRAAAQQAAGTGARAGAVVAGSRLCRTSAHIQRGGKMTKSATATPGSFDWQVSTVKMLGSGWSTVTVFTAWKSARSYL